MPLIILGRILRNLVSNAIKYTDRGRVLVGCRRRGDGVRIEVWDTGCGIPADQQRQIFWEFVSKNAAARAAGSDSGSPLSTGLPSCSVTALKFAHGRDAD